MPRHLNDDVAPEEAPPHLDAPDTARARGRTDGGNISQLLHEILPLRLDPESWALDLNAGSGEFIEVLVRRGARNVLGLERRRSLLRVAQQRLSPYRLRGWVRLREWAIGLPNDGAARERLHLDHVLVGLPATGSGYPVQLLKADADDAHWPVLLGTRRLDLVQRVCGEFRVTEPEQARFEGLHELAQVLAPLGFMVRWEIQRTADRDGLFPGLFWAERA